MSKISSCLLLLTYHFSSFLKYSRLKIFRKVNCKTYNSLCRVTYSVFDFFVIGDNRFWNGFIREHQLVSNFRFRKCIFLMRALILLKRQANLLDFVAQRKLIYLDAKLRKIFLSSFLLDIECKLFPSFFFNFIKY